MVVTMRREGGEKGDGGEVDGPTSITRLLTRGSKDALRELFLGNDNRLTKSSCQGTANGN